MIRHNVHLTSTQLKILAEFTKKDGISVAEHIRKSIDEYIQKKIRENLKVSPSSSKPQIFMPSLEQKGG